MGFLFAKAHEDDVCREAMEPGGEGGFAAEGVNFTEELKEGFLSEVFSLERIADHAKTETVNAAGVLAIELFECSGVTVLSAADGGIELWVGRSGRAHWGVGCFFHLLDLDGAKY